MDPQAILQKANLERKENKKYLQWLKTKHPQKLDDTVREIHDNVFEEVDCLSCANCCKTTSPIFYNKDIERAAKAIKMKAALFVETYLYLDADGDFVLKTAPCPFLADDNYCSIYEDRPLACKEYPHTNRKYFYRITDLTFRNLDVCPAVVKVVDKLKEVFFIK